MYKALAGVLFGAVISWIGMLFATSYYICKSTEKDFLISELILENKNYKERLDWWHEKYNSD